MKKTLIFPANLLGAISICMLLLSACPKVAAQNKPAGHSNTQKAGQSTPALTCATPGAYSACLVVMKAGLVFDDESNLIHCILGKDYGMDRPVQAVEYNNHKIIVKKGTIVDFFPGKPREGQFELGSMKSCTMGDTRGVICWGFRDAVVLPENSIITFTALNFPSNGDPSSPWDARQVRVDHAILGQTISLPGIGVVSKGTIIYFRFNKAEIDNGRITTTD